MNDIPVSVDSKEQKKSTARVTVHGDIAKKMKVGESAAMRMKGAVKSIMPAYDHAEHYDVEIEEPEIEHIMNDGKHENLADAPKHKEDLASMPKEKLKKKIMVKDTTDGY